MPGNSREMITRAERRFAVRIKIAIPPCGLGQRLPQINAWLDENCGSDGWVMTPSGMRGVLSEAASIYFADVTLASAFVARWCAGSKVETTGGLFHVRNNEPAPRVGARSTAYREGCVIFPCRHPFPPASGHCDRKRAWTPIRSAGHTDARLITSQGVAEFRLATGQE
jgi:hypothetical protein